MKRRTNALIALLAPEVEGAGATADVIRDRDRAMRRWDGYGIAFEVPNSSPARFE